MVTDPLTGVYSRATLERRLKEEIERALRYDVPFTIILLDLDHYKSINDAFGHRRGDQVLVEFVDRMRNMIRKSDIIFRYGGDEFLILLPNTPKDQGLQFAGRLLDVARNEAFPGKPPLTISISLGVASVPEDAQSPEALFEKADQRHYEAKRRGRGRVVGEDTPKSGLPEAGLLPFDDDSRLIERDLELAEVHNFFQDLPTCQRGVLTITGAPGSGRTRFLSETAKIARLQGYEVIPLHGSPALKKRTFGDLAEVSKQWELLAAPSAGEEIFGASLRRLVEEKGRSGLLFSIDNLPDVDPATLHLLRGLMLSTDPAIALAVAFTADLENARRMFPPVSSNDRLLQLRPLTPDGFRICTRLMLQWEAPADFQNWLFEQFRGLPAFLYRGLVDLVRAGVLEKSSTGWSLSPDYRKLAISETLGASQVTPPTNLPSPPTSFLGREEEIRAAKEALSNNRLLTILGPGGAGKTRLALQVAAEVMDNFPHGVYWISLAPLSSPDFLISSIAESLQFSFYRSEDPEVQLQHYFANKKILLVLDNFEHLTEGSEFLGRLLECTQQTTLLVTSRQRLDLRGETILELKGMSFPTRAPLDHIEGFPAVQLFVQTAKRADPDFFLSEDCKPFVAKICQLVEGLPLGIELAAAWVRSLSCAEIALEIEENLDFLVTPLRDVPDRHRSLRAVFEHSWRLLTEEEQRVLREISIFQGGFRREAAAKVVGASINQLSSLLNKSLLRRGPASVRYEMHETLRQYAMEKLEAHPEDLEAVHDRHSAYYADFLVQQDLRLNDHRQKETLQLIGEEIENIRAAWNWALRHQIYSRVDASINALFRYYHIRGLLHEGVQFFDEARKQLHDGPQSTALERSLLARVSTRSAAFYYLTSDYDQSQALLEAGLDTFREQNNRKEMAFALYNWGLIFHELGEYGPADAAFFESLSLYREIDDRFGIGYTLNGMGGSAYAQGEYQRAEQYHQESLRIFRSLDDPWGVARSLTNLGNVESELGDYLQARQFYEESITLCEELGARTSLGGSLNNLGDILMELTEYEEARRYLRRSLQVYAEMGDLFGVSVAQGNLGDLALRQGNYGEARDLFNQSLTISKQTGNRLQSAYVLKHLGDLEFALGRYPEAGSCFQKALSLASDTSALPIVLEVLVGMARLFWQNDEKARALKLLQYVQDHPAVAKSNRKDAELYYESWISEVTPEIFAQIQENPESRTLQEILEEIVGESCLFTH